MKFLKNKNQYIIYIVIFVILIIVCYTSYHNLIQKQYKINAFFLQKHAQSLSKMVSNDLLSFINDTRYISTMESLCQFIDDDPYHYQMIDRLQTYYEKYNDLILTVQIYNSEYSRSFTRHEGNYYNISPLSVSKRRLSYSQTVEFINDQIIYISPVRDSKGEISVNLLIIISMKDFIEHKLADHYIAQDSWAFILDHQSKLIIAKHSEEFINPLSVSPHDLSIISAKLISGLQGFSFSSIKIDRKNNNLISGYYPLKVFDQSYGIILSLSKKDVNQPILQLVLIFCLIILFVFLIFIHSYKVILKRVKIAQLESIRFENSISALIDNLPIGIIIFNDDNKILSINNAMFNQLELNKPDVMMSKEFDEKRYPEINSILREENKSFGTFKKIKIIHNNSEKWFLKSIIPIQLKDIDYLLILVNITEQELNLQNSRESNKMKDEFLSNMSHEFRTPLNSILGFTNLLNKNIVDQDSKLFIENIKKSANKLLSMFEEILHLVKLESNDFMLDPIPFDLLLLINDILKKYQTETDNKGLLLKREFGESYPLFLGDSFKLRVLLENIISNAVKFTHQGSVCINIDPLEMDNNFYRIKFTVSDTGIGIPQAKWDKIFDPFVQGDGSKTRNYSGTGIGLTIANKLSHIFDSSIKIEKSDQTGSVFSVIITLSVLEKNKMEFSNDYKEID